MAFNHQKSSHHIIQSFEADQLKNRTLIILIADWLTSSFGSIFFLLFNITVFTIWIAINTGNVKGIPVFDPFPFILLTMVVSLEAIILSIIVLMSQNKQSQISTLREELDMQVNLIAEKEITMTLKLLKMIAKKLDIDVKDVKIDEMIEETDVSYIQREIQHQLLENSKPKDMKLPTIEFPQKK